MDTIVYFTFSVLCCIGIAQCYQSCSRCTSFSLNLHMSFENHKMQGKLIKTLGITDIMRCFEECVGDCNCLSFQLNSTRCELNEEDKTTKPNSFVQASGYVYYGLERTQSSTECNNCYKCCYPWTCNDGDCTEFCGPDKPRYNCSCPLGNNIIGKTCDKEAVYIGCFNDDKDNRGLPSAFLYSKSSMTVDVCTRHCYNEGYNYAGLQYKYECWCGMNMTPYKQLSESLCNEMCGGDMSQRCGGSFRTSVYKLR